LREWGSLDMVYVTPGRVDPGQINTYTNDSKAPRGTQYYNTTSDQVKYKDADGNIVVPASGATDQYVIASQLVLGGLP